MSKESVRAVLVRYYDEIWNQGRLEVCDELIAPDYVNHSAPLPDLTPGPEGLKQTVAAVRRAFPDVHYTIEDMVIGRNKAALRVTMRGTHRGEFLGVAPTGRAIEVQEHPIEHLRDGQIVAHWHQIDDLGLQRQLGLLPHQRWLVIFRFRGRLSAAEAPEGVQNGSRTR
ncbi:MAG: ester cyclase [Chloroflexi bacterium]|nr:ester cyclase [Chloroflexota bacterium]